MVAIVLLSLLSLLLLLLLLLFCICRQDSFCTVHIVIIMTSLYPLVDLWNTE